MIDAAGARAYFEGGTKSRQWGEFAWGQQTAAIEQAKRDLSRALGRAMREDEPAYAYGDRTRDEFAVYEQALYTLLRDASPEGTGGSDVPSIEGDEKRGTAYTMARGRDKWSEEALAWLGTRSRVETVMG